MFSSDEREARIAEANARGLRRDLRAAKKQAKALADQLEEALEVMRAIFNGHQSSTGLLDCIDSSRAVPHAAGRKVA